MELVVALGIVALLAAVIYGSLRIAFLARASVQQAVEPIQRADLVVDFLRRDLESALPPTGTLAGVFVGVNNQDERGQDSDDLLLCAAVSAPRVALATDVRQIEYVVVSNSGDHVLLRRVTSNLLAPATVTPDDEVLCRGVHSFHVRYYDGTDWYDAWDSTQPPSDIAPFQSKALPQAVEVTVGLEPSSPKGSPLTVTRLIPLPCAVPPNYPPAPGGAP
jgi:hypothetical protein